MRSGWRPILLLALALLGNPTRLASQQQDLGSGTWQLTRNQGTIVGFSDHVSVTDGDTVGIYVSTPAPSFDVELYRLGWYDDGDSQARLIQRLSAISALVQPVPDMDPVTGLISCANWTLSASLPVQQWPTGLYLLKLIASDGDDSYIPLVVRDDATTHDFTFEHASATDQAYNAWGGKSFYDFNSSGDPVQATGRLPAVKSSFDRPFDKGGAGSSLAWELNMIRFLEANQFDVGYVSDVDVHADPTLADRTKVILQAGHNEYWSKEMRDHLEAARDRRTGLGFFTGDTGSWAIRFEDSALGSNRVEVFYGSASADPVAAVDPPHTTTHFYEAPLNRPLQAFIGIGTNAGVQRSADWVVDGAEHLPELFAGTGFHDGDVVSNLVGYEYDGLWTPGAPDVPLPGLQSIGRAHVVPTRPITELQKFAIRQPVPGPPVAGRLSTHVRPGQTWQLLVQLTAGGGSWVLDYRPGAAPPTHYISSGVPYATVSLGQDVSRPEWLPLELDLISDFRTAFGASPADPRVDGIVLRGQAAVGSIVLDGPNRTVLPASTGPDGWRVADGKGSVTVEPGGAGGEPTVRAEPARSNRPVDEADTVVIRTPAGGLIVAVGTIQWSWALDAYGAHTDSSGNHTPLDPRLQSLTRNMLLALRSASPS